MGPDPLTIVYTDSPPDSHTHVVYLSPLPVVLRIREGVWDKHEENTKQNNGVREGEGGGEGIKRTHNEGHEARRD